MAKNKNHTEETIVEVKTVDVSTKEETKSETNTAKKKEPREISVNEYINVRSVTEGSLSYLDKRTNMKYLWSNYGAIQSMTFDALLSMKASHPIFLTTPYIVIDDEDVVTKLNIGYVYNDFDFEIADDLEKFFTTSINDMRNHIRKLPECIKENIKLKARDLYKKKILSDLNRIKMLEQELNIDLSILSDDI